MYLGGVHTGIALTAWQYVETNKWLISDYLADASALNAKHSHRIRCISHWIRFHQDFMRLRSIGLRIRRFHKDTVRHKHICPRMWRTYSYSTYSNVLHQLWTSKLLIRPIHSGINASMSLSTFNDIALCSVTSTNTLLKRSQYVYVNNLLKSTLNDMEGKENNRKVEQLGSKDLLGFYATNLEKSVWWRCLCISLSSSRRLL